MGSLRMRIQPPPGPISFIYVQFSANILSKYNRLAIAPLVGARLCEILERPSTWTVHVLTGVTFSGHEVRNNKSNKFNFAIKQQIRLVTMADEYKHIDITIDQDNCDDGIFQLLHKIRPDWKEEHISFEVLNSFYINLKIQLLHKFAV